MNYKEALEYLLNLDVFGWHPGLARIEKLMEVLGNPEKEMKFVHIGGTNGKGSTTAMTASILKNAGYKTGMFISPQLSCYNERIQVNGEYIPNEKLADLATYIKDKIQVMLDEGYEHPTGFEVCTALAILYFYREKVDVVVLEVGLGGAIDSTNIITPLVSAITNVSMDHMDYLGETIREIAEVKSGIIKKGIPCITAAEEEDALEVIERVAAENNAPLIRVGRDVHYSVLELSEEGTKFAVKYPDGQREEYFTPLIGVHQAINGTTVVSIIKELNKAGLTITRDNILEGMKDTVWPARLEIISRAPEILLDAAHNFDGAVKLRSSLSTIFKYKRLIYVIGMLADKQRFKVMQQLGPLADIIIVTKPNSPRAGDWTSMTTEARKYTPHVHEYEIIEEAVNKALEVAGEDDLICITGSIYMVAYAREYLLNR